MKTPSLNDLLNAVKNPQPKVKTVEIKDVGRVNIRELTAGEREDVIAVMLEGCGLDETKITRKSLVKAQYTLISRTVVDNDGKPLFTFEELQGAPVSMTRAIDAIYTETEKVNGLFNTAEENIKKN